MKNCPINQLFPIEAFGDQFAFWWGRRQQIPELWCGIESSGFGIDYLPFDVLNSTPAHTHTNTLTHIYKLTHTHMGLLTI